MTVLVDRGDMVNEAAREVRLKLLRRYYRSAALGWFLPKGLHWAKIVTDDGHWRWIRADSGVRGVLLKDPPIHVYQTVLAFRSNEPPRGFSAVGHMLGGPLLFDIDLAEAHSPISLWRLVDAGPMIADLIDTVQDRGPYEVKQVMFSGLRGVHVLFERRLSASAEPIVLTGQNRNHRLTSFKEIRRQTARAIGYWCPGWDWKVTSDIWRVTRVPWSIHGTSALRAIVLAPPFNPESLRRQLLRATPFTLVNRLRLRMTHSVSVFTFVDGEAYGPYRRGWATKLPVAVAMHLLWLGSAKLRENVPVASSRLFEQGWQTLFRKSSLNPPMRMRQREEG